MSPWKTLWSIIVTVAVSSWAGGASAQGDDGGWYEDSDRSERPALKIHGKGPYDPPPPDFRADDPTPPVYDDADDEAEDEPAEDEIVDEETEAQGQRQAVREFSPHLAPYGHWVDDSYYGRIWVPARTVVGADFSPYVSAGHWELTSDDQWLWVSDYPFGWVTFHYGRWVWGSSAGWGWVPGYRYAPAWVDFRIGTGGYVGWGPASPSYVWRGGLFVSLGARRTVPYVFCPTTYVFAPSLHRHVIRDRYRVRSIAAQTYRYRPQRVAGVYTRSPNPVQARIPSRYVPTRRAVARPRVGDSRGNLVRSYSLRDAGGVTRASSRGQVQTRRDAAFAERGESRRTATEVRRARAERQSSGARGYRSAPDRDVRRGDARSDRGTWRDDGRRGRDVRRDEASGRNNDSRRASPYVTESRRERSAAPPARASSPRDEAQRPPRARARGSDRGSDPQRSTRAGSGQRRGEARGTRGNSTGGRSPRARSREPREPSR
jgi:hypothetical protein